METQVTTKAETGPDWLAVGSSPGAVAWLSHVMELPAVRGAHTITTNRGIELFADDSPPDVYFLGGELLTEGEQFAKQREAGRRIKDMGSRVVGLARTPEINAEWGIDWLDEFIIIDVGCWKPWKFIRGHYTACHLSGLFCLQYAVNHGAKNVHLVGMEGYGSSGHYFDGSEDSVAANDKDLTVGHIEPFTQAVVKACPKVEFTFYGNLEYAIHGDNVTKVFELPATEAVVIAKTTPAMDPVQQQ